MEGGREGEREGGREGGREGERGREIDMNSSYTIKQINALHHYHRASMRPSISIMFIYEAPFKGV